MKLDQVRPSDEELRVILEAGFALRYTRRLDEAADIFRGVVALMPKSDIPRVALGTVELERGKFAEAQSACEEALRNDPESLYARVHRAEALLFQKTNSRNPRDNRWTDHPKNSKARMRLSAAAQPNRRPTIFQHS